MTIVITSVQYADFLAVTLPGWLKILPAKRLLVATSPDDHASQQIAASLGVRCHVTDTWTRIDPAVHQGGPATFNLALGLDDALGLPRATADLVGHVSADCYPFGRFPKVESFDRDAVYGFWRYECLSPKGLRAHVSGARPITAYPKLKNSHGWPIGYCQFFVTVPGRRFGSYPTAGKFDTHFSATFDRKVMRNELYFLHLGPISIKANWAGRTVPVWGSAVPA